MTTNARPDPGLEAAVSRLLGAAEKFRSAAGELPPQVLKREAARWSPKRLERLADLLAGVLVSAEDLTGALETAQERRRAVAEAAYARWKAREEGEAGNAGARARGRPGAAPEPPGSDS